MDGRAGASRWLAVVCRAIPGWSELPSKADMACSVVFFSNGLEMDGYGMLSGRFICKGQRECVSVKFAAFGFEQTGSRTLEGGKCVPHGLAHRVEHDTKHLHGVRISSGKEFVECHEDVASAEITRV